jgi:hypothetical protein
MREGLIGFEISVAIISADELISHIVMASLLLFVGYFIVHNVWVLFVPLDVCLAQNGL